MEKKISIVLPVFNEEGNLIPLVESIHAVMKGYDFEIIAVNDGSDDQSSEHLSIAKKSCPNLTIINLKRNFGQTAALSAGIDKSKGDVVITIDADGQNDPSDIPIILNEMSKGFDVVSGWRVHRKDSFFLRIMPSTIANRIISAVTGVKLHDYGCTLKAYRKNMIADVQMFGDMHRFLPAWCVWQGGKVSEIPVKHNPRKIGKSKYGLSRTFKVIFDLLTLKFFSGYLFKPGHLFSGAGLIFFLFSVIASATAVIDKFGPDYFPKFRIPLLLVAIFFGLAAIFLILMGLLAELLVRLYFQVRRQKSYRLADE